MSVKIKGTGVVGDDRTFTVTGNAFREDEANAAWIEMERATWDEDGSEFTEAQYLRLQEELDRALADGEAVNERDRFYE